MKIVPATIKISYAGKDLDLVRFNGKSVILGNETVIAHVNCVTGDLTVRTEPTPKKLTAEDLAVSFTVDSFRGAPWGKRARKQAQWKQSPLHRLQSRPPGRS